jgi:hypothetical protein
MSGSSGEQDIDQRKEDEQGVSGSTPETAASKAKCKSNTLQKVHDEQQLLGILKDKIKHIHEDKAFFLFLVPMFKKLTDDKK